MARYIAPAVKSMIMPPSIIVFYNAIMFVKAIEFTNDQFFKSLAHRKNNDHM